MVRTCLCDYSETYALVTGTITVTGAGNDDAPKWLDERSKGLICKNYAPFIDCISEINNIEIDNAKYIGVVTPMYNFI